MSIPYALSSCTLVMYFDRIQLPNEFEELCSRFAEHLHDSWAVQRMMEDSSDPGLVPYMSLDNIER